MTLCLYLDLSAILRCQSTYFIILQYLYFGWETVNLYSAASCFLNSLQSDWELVRTWLDWNKLFFYLFTYLAQKNE